MRLSKPVCVYYGVGDLTVVSPITGRFVGSRDFHWIGGNVIYIDITLPDTTTVVSNVEYIGPTWN